MDILGLPYVSDMTVNFVENHVFRLMGAGLLIGFGFSFLICVLSYVVFKFYSCLSDIK